MSLISRGEKAINERYRPMRFSEVIGCEKTKDALSKWMNQGEKRSKAVLLHGISGGGKAQPLTSKILGQNGWVLMKDINVGDKIVGGDGKICEVQGVFPQGRRSIYKILFSDGTFIEVSDNHLNSVFIYNTKKKCREDYVLDTLELKKLVENSKNKYRVDMPIIDCWADKDITINPYLLGALIGDGSFSGNFGFSNSEEDVVQNVNNILTSEWNMKLVRVNENCYDYRIVFCDNNDYKYSFIYKDKQFNTIKAIQKHLSREGYPVFDSLTIKNICNGNAVNTLKKYPELNNAIKLVENNSYKCWNEGISPLKNELKKYGLLCKSVQKHIPAQYLFASYNTRMELLRGLFDTDGYTPHGEGCGYEFTTSSNQLAQDFEFLVRSLGIQCSRREKKSAYKNENNEIISCNTSFFFYLHPSNDMKIFTSLKHSSHYYPKQNPPMRKIVSISYDREDECQCIYVSNDSHTYITDNFTVTHNTTIARILAMGLNCEKGDSVEPCLECPSCKAAMAAEAMHIQEYNMSALTRKEDADEIINSLSDSCFTGRNKVLILDEVQGMSASSQNLILKSLENPPPNTYLILCTTNPEKLLKTVRNRCEQYEFKNPTYDDIKIVLGNIVKQEMPEMNISQRKEILEACRGLSYREILMKLEKFIKGGGTDSISEAFQANYFEFCKLVAYGKFREAMEYIEKNEDDFDIEAARRMMRTYFCNAMVSSSKTNDSSVHKYYLMCRIFDKGFYTDPNPMPSFKMDVYEACQIMIKTYG